jgi:rhodanese-related sulfurtransferase
MSILGRLRAAFGGSGGSGGRKVDVQQAQQLQQSGAVLLDVRTREEFKGGHAPKARNIPLDQLPARAREVPTGRQVLAICQSGGRSARATAVLRDKGYDVLDVRGGMSSWQRAGLPVEGGR